jgi:hypothetical protein
MGYDLISNEDGVLRLGPAIFSKPKRAGLHTKILMDSDSEDSGADGDEGSMPDLEGSMPDLLDHSVHSLTETMGSASLNSPPAAQPDSPLTGDRPQAADTFDYREAIDRVVVDLAGGLVDPASSLRVGPSRYWAPQGEGFADIMGDGLFARVNIEAGTLIATFRGTLITASEARNIPHGDNNYLIDMQDGTVLNCSDNVTTRPPRCLASLINQADGAQDPGTGRILTYDDNNAYVVWYDVDGVRTASAYAVRQVGEEEEILWNYGATFAQGFQRGGYYTSSDSEEQSFSDDDSGSRALSDDPQALALPLGQIQRLRAVRRRLQAAHFTDEDAFPEMGFNNDSLSSESGSVSVADTAPTATTIIEQTEMPTSNELASQASEDEL